MSIFAASLLVAATPQPALAPNGSWEVKGEDGMCLLQIDYASGGEALSLVFKPLLDLPTMELYVIGGDASGRQFDGEYTAQLLAPAKPYAGRYFSVRSELSKRRVTRLTVERDLLDQLNDQDVLRIAAKPIDRSFIIVAARSAKAALQTCTDRLKRSWGIVPVPGEGVSQLVGDPAEQFGASSYPPEALRKRIYGRVIALLKINGSGAVDGCRVLSSAGPELNAGTCKAAMKIRFTPPRDKSGNGLRSTYVLPVRWVLAGMR